MNIYKFWKCWQRRPGREETLLEKFTMASKWSTFIGDSIGCENVEIIRITRDKFEIGLRFKKKDWLRISLVRGNLLLCVIIIFIKCYQAWIKCLENITVIFVQMFRVWVCLNNGNALIWIQHQIQLTGGKIFSESIGIIH